MEKLLEETTSDIELLQLGIDSVNKQLKKCVKLLNAGKGDEFYLALEELDSKRGSLNKQLKKCIYKCVKLSRKLS